MQSSCHTSPEKGPQHSCAPAVTTSGDSLLGHVSVCQTYLTRKRGLGSADIWCVEILWGDRFAWLKIALALGAATLLCGWATRIYGARYPSAGAIRRNPERFEGRTTVLPPTPVRRSGIDSFLVHTVKVRSKGTWKEGEMVAVRGIVRGGAIEAETVRRLPGYRWKRGAMYGVSGLLAFVILTQLLRRTRLRDGLFVSRY